MGKKECRNVSPHVYSGLFYKQMGHNGTINKETWEKHGYEGYREKDKRFNIFAQLCTKNVEINMIMKDIVKEIKDSSFLHKQIKSYINS